MKPHRKNVSEFRLAIERFKENRLASFCAMILCGLYGMALFAGFLAPYSYHNEDRRYSYAPPTLIHFSDENGLAWPFVYGMHLTFDEYKRRVYVFDQDKKFPIRFFVKGDEYRFLWLFPTQRHLVGIEGDGRFYLLGADARGRDMLSRIIYGSQISLSIGLIGVAISFSIGSFVGGIAGFYSGWVDNLLMRLCELVMMVPSFYLLLALRAAVPDSFNSVQVYFAIIVILSFIGWAGLARIIRGMCLSLKERDYVVAAKSMGVSDLKIILNHILPHTISYSIFAVMLAIPGYILGEAGLSLIGLGIQDPFASWGNLLSDAMSIVRIKFAPWILWPGFFIFLTVICFNVVGDALRDVFDPLMKGKKARA